VAVIASGQERAETEERLRKCRVRIVTQNISQTPLEEEEERSEVCGWWVVGLQRSSK